MHPINYHVSFSTRLLLLMAWFSANLLDALPLTEQAVVLNGNQNVTSDPMVPDGSATGAASSLNWWFENPWIDTKGGTLSQQPVSADNDSMLMMRNETEQVMLVLENRSSEQKSFRLSLESSLPKNATKTEMFVVGGILSRYANGRDESANDDWKGTSGVALVNLLNEKQIKAFGKIIPPTFVEQETWKNFPDVVLKPGAQIRLWIQVKTFQLTGTERTICPPGHFSVEIAVKEANTDKVKIAIPVKVVSATMPSDPLVEVLPYGGVSTQDGIDHHTTVTVYPERDIGHGRLIFLNVFAATNNWNIVTESMASKMKSSPADLERVGKALDTYYRMTAKAGFGENQSLVEIQDEPTDKTADWWVTIAKMIRQLRPDAKIVANPPAHWEVGLMPATLDGTFKKLAPYVDIWIPHISHLKNKEIVSFMKSTGKPIWFYNNCALQYARVESGISDTFRKMGWSTIENDLQGMGFWSAHFPNGDMWDDFDTTKESNWNDAAVVFPSPAGAIATRGWEAWRETVEDVNIHRMLQRRLTDPELPTEIRGKILAYLDASTEAVANCPPLHTASLLEKLRREGTRLLELRDLSTSN